MKTSFFLSKASSVRRMMGFLVIICAAMLVACTSTTQLEIEVAAAAADCPMVLDNGFTITNIDTEDNNVVYECVMDESESDVLLSDMDVLEVRAELKEELLESIRTEKLYDDDIKDMVKLCKDANYNIIFRLIGSHSGYKMDIVLYSHEL